MAYSNTITLLPQVTELFYLLLALDIYHDFAEKGASRGRRESRIVLSMMGIDILLRDRLERMASERGGLSKWQEQLSLLGLTDYVYAGRDTSNRVFTNTADPIKLSVQMPAGIYQDLYLKVDTMYATKEEKLKHLFAEYIYSDRDLLRCVPLGQGEVPMNEMKTEECRPGNIPGYHRLLESLRISNENEGTMARMAALRQRATVTLRVEIQLKMFDIAGMFRHIRHNHDWINTLGREINRVTSANLKNKRIKFESICDIRSSIFNLPVGGLLSHCSEVAAANDLPQTKPYDKSFCRDSQFFDAQSLCQKVPNSPNFQSTCPRRTLTAAGTLEHSLVIRERVKPDPLIEIIFVDNLKDGFIEVTGYLVFLGILYKVPAGASARRVAEGSVTPMAKTIGDLAQVMAALTCGADYVTNDYFSLLTAIPLMASLPTSSKLYWPSKDLAIGR